MITRLIRIVLVPDDIFCAVEKLIDGQRTPRRRGVRQKEPVQTVDPFRPSELTKREVALAPRRARLNDGSRDARDYAEERKRCEGDRRAVAADEFRRPIPDRIGPGADWPLLQVAPEIVGECRPVGAHEILVR